MRKILFLFSFLCVVFLSGCVTINSDIHVRSDFSGEWTSVIQSQVGPFTRSDLEGEIQKAGLTDYKLSPIGSDGKVVANDQTRGAYSTWQLEMRFKDSADLTKLGRTLLSSHRVGAVDIISPVDGNNKVYNFQMGTAVGVTRITIDGNIIKESVGAGSLKDNTVTYYRGQQIRFQFEKKSPMLLYLGYAAILLVLGGGAYYFYTKRKNTEGDAA